MKNRLVWVLIVGVIVGVAGSAYGYEILTHQQLTDIAAEKSTLNQNRTLSRIGLPAVSITDGDEIEFDDKKTINYFPGSVVSDETGHMSIFQLLLEGTDREDTIFPVNSSPGLGIVRVRHHFYDPQNGGAPLIVGGEAGEPSPTWILEDQGDILDDPPDIETDKQLFSLKESKNYFYNAITAEDGQPGALPKIERDRNFGLFFQSLGHVAHHVQDMGQPQHVRNDAHFPWEDDLYEHYVLENYSKDGGELNTNDEFKSSFAQIINERPFNNGNPVSFPRARDYWDWSADTSDGGSSRIGLAEFAATNFVTDDTNFSGSWTSPQPNSDLPLPTLAANGVGNLLDFSEAMSDCRRSPVDQSGATIVGKLRWLSTDVTDGYLAPQDPGRTTTNPMASSLSIWYDKVQEMVGSGFAGTGFALNGCVFDSRLNFVIPRIVAFSTGLIDHVFRGELEISSPDEGVYAIKDHDPGGGQAVQLDSGGKTVVNGTPFGYDKIRLRLKNTTPNIELPDHVPFNSGPTSISQDMFDGTIQAIVKYSLNHCFLDDGSGGFGHEALESVDSIYLNSDLASLSTRSPAGCSASTYFSNGSATDSDKLTLDIRRRNYEHISKSVIQNIGPDAGDVIERIDKNDSIQLEFDFSSDPIPLNAIDVRLQVVYRGKLGPEDESGLPAGTPTMVEDDAVVVATKDISEPSDLVVANLTDHVLNMPARKWISLVPAANSDGSRPDSFELTVDPTYLNPGNYKYYFYADRPGAIPPPILKVDLTVPSRFEIRLDEGVTPLSAAAEISGIVNLKMFPQDADNDLVGLILEDGAILESDGDYEWNLDTTLLGEGKHTISAALRYGGKLISFDTDFVVHNNSTNTAPDLAPIADVDQIVDVDTFQAIDVPLTISDSDEISITNITLSSDVEGLIDPSRFVEVRPDSAGGFLLHFFNNVEHAQQPGALPLFHEYSHIGINVTVSDGELEDTESFVFRRLVQGYTSQGYFQPHEIVLNTDQLQTLPVTLLDVAGTNVQSGNSYTIENDINLPVLYQVMGELGVDQSVDEGLLTNDQANDLLFSEWTLAGGEYDNLGEFDLLKKLIDDPGWLNQMPSNIQPDHEFVTFNENLSFTFKANGSTDTLAEIDDLDLGQYVRFSVLSDLDKTFSLTGGALGYLMQCNSIKPEIHQWEEGSRAYIQRGSVWKIGDTYSATRGLYSLICQLPLHTVGNLGLTDQTEWSTHIENMLDSENLVRQPMDVINVNY